MRRIPLCYLQRYIFEYLRGSPAGIEILTRCLPSMAMFFQCFHIPDLAFLFKFYFFDQIHPRLFPDRTTDRAGLPGFRAYRRSGRKRPPVWEPWIFSGRPPERSFVFPGRKQTWRSKAPSRPEEKPSVRSFSCFDGSLSPRTYTWRYSAVLHIVNQKVVDYSYGGQE